jgi:hypothetical protein
MAKLQSTEIVGVATRPATICLNTVCLWFDTTNLKPMASFCTSFNFWTTGGALISAKQSLGGAGTQNEGLAIAGYPNGCCTEEYNGTSWSAGGALSMVTRYQLAGAGTQNAGLAIGGRTNSGPLSCTNEYNGTSWSAGGALSLARYSLVGAGTQNEALGIGGFGPVTGGFRGVTCTEEYNGTSWATGGVLITAR